MTDYRGILDGYTQADLTVTRSGPPTPYGQALLIIREDNSVAFTIRTYSGGDATPESEWRGRDLVYALCANPDIDEVQALLSDGGSAALLIEQVVAGRRGVMMTVAAHAASAELTAMMEQLPFSRFLPWDGEEWLTQGNSHATILHALGLHARSTPSHIAEAAENLRASAKQSLIVLTGDSLEAVLTRIVAAHFGAQNQGKVA